MIRAPLAFVALLMLGGCTVQPEAQCRIGFDIGSSGIRVGSTTGDLDGKVSIDYLADVWNDNVINQTNDATARALGDLAAGRRCITVAGGYSAWRLAVERGGGDRVAATLHELHARTGVAIFVMPQAVEGGYGYYAAKQQLGDRLATPFILDIGGGSMQFAASNAGWGTALGQKAWLKSFCAEAKGSTVPTCAANPVGDDAIAQAQHLLAPLVADARARLGHGFTVTAVSTPVVRGIHPILRHMAPTEPALAGHVDDTGFDIQALETAIAILGRLDDAGILARLDGCGAGQSCTPRFVGTFVTDMLLVQGFMAGLDIKRLEVAEVDLTNVPGILADDRATAWAGQYGCYLDRLRRQGIDAYSAGPESCR